MLEVLFAALSQLVWLAVNPKPPSRVIQGHVCNSPTALHAGLHYDALAVAAFEGAPEQLDAISIPTSGPRTDMVMQVGGWSKVERLSITFLAPSLLNYLPLAVAEP